jgi:hypothetical protein
MGELRVHVSSHGGDGVSLQWAVVEESRKGLVCLFHLKCKETGSHSAGSSFVQTGTPGAS